GPPAPPPPATPAPPSATPAPPTATPAPPTATPPPSTATSVPPTGTSTQPTNTPVPPTDTPVLPTATSAPATPTQAPPTGTPVPGEFTFDLRLNGVFFRPWDHFLLTACIENPGEPVDVFEYILLDVYGNYWFWPSWSVEPDYRSRTIPSQAAGEETILDFWWPAGVGSAEGLLFWGAVLDSEFMMLLGDYDMVEFGYGG
ncbi:hypothetical protein JXA40_08385, partial [bacterium]|nr:hypothetical protein [candidate division CSSED10-310 bacterium]